MANPADNGEHLCTLIHMTYIISQDQSFQRMLAKYPCDQIDQLKKTVPFETKIILYKFLPHNINDTQWKTSRTIQDLNLRPPVYNTDALPAKLMNQATQQNSVLIHRSPVQTLFP